MSKASASRGAGRRPPPHCPTTTILVTFISQHANSCVMWFISHCDTINDLLPFFFQFFFHAVISSFFIVHSNKTLKVCMSTFHSQCILNFPATLCYSSFLKWKQQAKSNQFSFSICISLPPQCVCVCSGFPLFHWKPKHPAWKPKSNATRIHDRKTITSMRYGGMNSEEEAEWWKSNLKTKSIMGFG